MGLKIHIPKQTVGVVSSPPLGKGLEGLRVKWKIRVRVAA